LSSFPFGKRTIARMKVVNFGCYIPDFHWKTDENWLISFRAHEKCVCPTIELLLVDSPKKWILQT